ncbi:Tetratricopeptide repeat-containing protein [Humidesulfovibrio mexicanus]|uniref:Tetratricopeptide repeat-containing protein n=1 Tax=Humidesulfovibrio mexicanus TaxID=147047 RepID=A0A239CW57_9BACT|nr:tetratricopeptide repeat protein [Humidesulfovibrio mexicanus]SNS23593.1 Tetratricopeptide repeat-containing protein [Humidesulfovibrio mexicanus]
MRRISSLGLRPALFLAMALCTACAPAQPRVQPPRPVAQAASSTYDYLEYQALLQQMSRTASTARLSPEAFARTLALQKAAARALDRVIARESAPSLYMDKAFLYWNPEQAGQARTILDQGLEKYPNDYNLNAALANAFLMENRLAEAAAVLSGYLSRQENTTLRERLGQLYVDSEQPEKALETLKRIPPKERSADAQFQMARAEARLGRKTAAMNALKQLLKQNPEHLEAWVELAFQQEMDRDYAAAVATYSQILELGATREDIRQRIENGGGEGREDIRLRVVGLWLKLNNPDKALDAALRSSGGKPFILAAALLFLNESYSAQASTLLDVLASQPPVPGEYFFYKAVIAHDGEGNPQKALQFLDLVPESDPHFSQALQFRIQLLYGMGREHEAVALMDQGKRLYPGQSRFPLLQAGYLIEKKRLPEAREVLEKALDDQPEDEDLRYQLGAVLDRQGDRKTALGLMQKIVDKNPDHADALNYIGYTLAEEGRDLERALALVKKADRLKPENGYIVDSLAWTYFRLGKLEEAWKHIQRAVTLTKDDPTMWEHYGDIAKQSGRAAQAQKAYQNALKFKHEHPERIKKKLRAK